MKSNWKCTFRINLNHLSQWFCILRLQFISKCCVSRKFWFLSFQSPYPRVLLTRNLNPVFLQHLWIGEWMYTGILTASHSPRACLKNAFQYFNVGTRYILTRQEKMWVAEWYIGCAATCYARRCSWPDVCLLSRIEWRLIFGLLAHHILKNDLGYKYALPKIVAFHNTRTRHTSTKTNHGHPHWSQPPLCHRQQEDEDCPWPLRSRSEVQYVQSSCYIVHVFSSSLLRSHRLVLPCWLKSAGK